MYVFGAEISIGQNVDKNMKIRAILGRKAYLGMYIINYQHSDAGVPKRSRMTGSKVFVNDSPKSVLHSVVHLSNLRACGDGVGKRPSSYFTRNRRSP